MKNDHKIRIAIIQVMIVVLLSMPLNNLVGSFKLSFYYLFFFIIPFIPFTKKEDPLIENILLINVMGLSFASIYVILDVIFKVPLSKFIYLVFASIMILYSWVLKKEKK